MENEWRRYHEMWIHFIYHDEYLHFALIYINFCYKLLPLELFGVMAQCTIIKNYSRYIEKCMNLNQCYGSCEPRMDLKIYPRLGLGNNGIGS